MDVLKDYLEASSLAGLSFISSSNSVWSRSAWIIAVIPSVFFAVYQIDSTFKSWDKNPVSTDVEALPISGVKLPGITVCPPKGSHTGLNYDLIRARNITLENKDRQEMINYAVDILIDDDVIVDEVHMFSTEDRQRNTLVGNIPFFQKEEWDSNIFLTSATSGSVSNIGFGEQFELAKFPFKYKWDCYLQIDYKLKLLHPGSHFVIEIQKDIGGDFGIEELWIHYPDNKAFCRRSAEKNRICQDLGKYFRKTIKRKIPIGYFKHGGTFDIEYIRSWSQKDFDLWEEKRMTGFHAKWYFEDENGTIIDVYQPPAFVDNYTLAFQEFVNLVNTEVTHEGILVEDIQGRLNRLKRDWIIGTKHDLEDASSPKYMGIIDIKVLLSKFSDDISVIQNGNLSSGISDDILEIGYKLFKNLILCPAGRGDNNISTKIRKNQS